MRLHRLAFPLCLAASTAIAIPAAAQPSGPSTTAVAATDRARSLHVEGARLFELGKYDEAYVAFLAAWALKKHPQIAGNLADCEVKIGKYRDAAEHFAFMARDPNHEAKPEAKRLAQERLKDVQTRIGTVTISVSSNGAELMLDGKALGTSPLEGPIFVDPGAHVVEATLKGHKPARMPVDAPKGSTQNVALTLEVVPDAPPVPPVVERRPLWPAIAAGSVAVVALGVGAGLAVAANGKASSSATLLSKVGSSSACAGTLASSPDCTALMSDLKSRDALTKGAFSSFVIGGGFAVAAAGLLSWVATSPKAEKSAPTIRITPALGRAEGGIVVLGSF
jgi:hypothetical protein